MHAPDTSARIATTLRGPASISPAGNKGQRQQGIRRRQRLQVGVAALCALLLLAASSVQAAPTQAELRSGELINQSVQFVRLDSARGLAQNTIQAVLQDSDGFIWIGTQAGLHRHDGNQLLLYQQEAGNPGSLSENLITSLCQGGEFLWVGTHGAHINRLHLRSGTITRFELGEQPGHARVRGLACTDTHVWAGTEAGLVEGQIAANGQLTLHAAAGDAVNALALGRSGTLWQSHAGQLSVHPEDHTAVSVDGLVQTLIADSEHELLVGTERGLFALPSPGADQLLRLWPNRTGDPGGDVRGVQRDPLGRLWLAVRGRGLLRLDTDGSEQWLPVVERAQHEEAETNLRNLMLDRSQRLWLGTDFGGVLHADSQGAAFQWLHPAEAGARFSIRSIAEDDSGRLWLGGDNGNLWMLDAARRHWTDFAAVWRRHLGVEDTELTAVNALLVDSGQLLVATSHGLLDLDLTTLELKPRQAPAGFELLYQQVRALHIDAGRTLWLASYGSGLLQLPVNGEPTHFHRLAEPPRQLYSDQLLALHADDDGRIWIGNMDGIALLDAGVAHNIRAADHTRALSGRIVRAIERDRDGALWFATHGGLNRLDRVDLDAGEFAFSRFGRQPGLPGTTLYGVLDDGIGGLWISGNQGLARRDLVTGNFRSFDLRDGLQALEFNGGAQLRLSSGKLAFGGIKGLNLFDPDQAAAHYSKPQLLLNAWSADGQRRLIHDGRPPEVIEVPASQRTLSLEFAVLDVVDPLRHRLAWRLQGLSDEWVDSGNSRSVTWSHLSPGSYLFELRAMSEEGLWMEPTLRAHLHVLAPAWRHPLAMLAYLTALAGIVVLLLGLRQRRQQLQRSQLRTLRISEDRLRLALWGSGEGLWDWDLVSGEVYRSGMGDILGYAPEQRSADVSWHRSRIHPDDLAHVQARLQQHLAGDISHYESEYRIRHARGHWIWLLDRGKVVERDSAGRPLRMAGTQRDITSLRHADDERRIAAEVIRSMSEAVTVTDLAFCFISVNPAFERITGYTFRDVAGENASLINSPLQDERDYLNARRLLREQGQWRGELWQRRRDGSDMLCWLQMATVSDSAGQASHYVGVFTDVTESRRAEQELRYLANYDTLTGLPNRVLLGERLATALVRARRQQRLVAVLFMDLDHFKHVNDSMGHAAGDELLREIARRLKSQSREGDTVARLGGDEFTMVMEDLADEDAARRTAERILEAFREPTLINGHELVISPSLGVALYPAHGENVDELLKSADTAMYAAKARGRDNYQLYSLELARAARERVGLEASLRRALEREELRLVFQPKQRLADGRITGVEALLRWHSEEHGDVAPTRFISIAEDTGLIISIGEWVLRQACRQLAQWQAQGLPAITMAVNISVLQLLRGDLAQRLLGALKDAGIRADQLELELTESMLMANADQAVDLLRELKSLGARVAIDDFGTGYSSLAYLKRLPIDTLKVDKAFVNDICDDPEDATIVSTVIAMAHAMGLHVVAEGVETQAQMDFLHTRRCDAIQGHYLSPPLEAEQCAEFLSKHQLAETSIPGPLGAA